MGTRGLTVVIKDGKTKVAQYGQWDHYPDGQGVGILRWLREPGNLDALRAHIDDEWKPLTDELAEQIDKEHGSDWKTEYPELHRDTGGDILGLIAEGRVKVLRVEPYPVPDNDIWIEGQFIVDLDKGVYISKYRDGAPEFPLDGLPTDEDYLASWPDED